MARVYGLEWTNDTVKNVEAGSRVLAIGEWFLLLVALRVGEEEYFGKDSPGVELSPVFHLEPGGLSATLRGEQFAFDEEEWLRRDQEAAELRLAERKAAEELGIDVPTLKKLSRSLWGRGLTRERERRLDEQVRPREVTPRSRQALRGHVTRALLEELRQKVAAVDARTRKKPKGGSR